MQTLSTYFRSQADWRRGKAEEYPDDPRNLQSAEALDSLAAYVEHEDAALLAAALEPHLDDDGLGGDQTAREVARYGFGFGTSTRQHFEFLEELCALCAEDAYTAVFDGGDGAAETDAAETLHPFELEAAAADVDLPRRYFELRRRTPTHELEEIVAEFRAGADVPADDDDGSYYRREDILQAFLDLQAIGSEHGEPHNEIGVQLTVVGADSEAAVAVISEFVSGHQAARPVPGLEYAMAFGFAAGLHLANKKPLALR